MTNILTDAQAANFLRTSTTDAVMLQLLPLVDEYIKNATGHDWASDATIDNTANIAAGMLLTFWYDNPSMVGQAPAAVRSTLMQLEAKALRYRKYQFDGGSAAGGVTLEGARIGDVVIKLVGVYGVSGSQTSKFESTITVDDQIQQTEAADLSDNQYVVVLKHPAEDVSP
jgi:hypothetical protein